MIVSLGLKRWMTRGILVLGLAASFGCQRDHNPLLATPASGANQVTMTRVSVDESQAPELRLTFDVVTDLGPVNDLVIGNFAILLDNSTPEVPLRLEKYPTIDGRYTIVFRSRSTDSSAAWKGIYLSYGNLPVTYINP